MSIKLQSDAGVLKSAPTGFSWTTLFFSMFVPLLRGDIKWAIIMFIVNMVTCCFTLLVFPFFYNKVYIQSLLAGGFAPADEESKAYLVKAGLMS